MKKIIALSLLALTLGANVPSTVKANGFTDKAKATVKKVTLTGAKLATGTLITAAVVVTGVAIVCGVDAALAWANKIGLPATFFNQYTFGTFYNAIRGWVEPIVTSAPEYFKTLPEKISPPTTIFKLCEEINDDRFCINLEQKGDHLISLNYEFKCSDYNSCQKLSELLKEALQINGFWFRPFDTFWFRWIWG